MSKWISDAYIKRVLKNNRLAQGNCEYKLWEQEVEKTVDATPSIDIVFCKECKWYKKSEAFCENGNGLWQAGDECFCSYGERSDT